MYLQTLILQRCDCTEVLQITHFTLEYISPKKSTGMWLRPKVILLGCSIETAFDLVSNLQLLG